MGTAGAGAGGARIVIGGEAGAAAETGTATGGAGGGRPSASFGLGTDATSRR
jgi:hypothetical protein